MAFSPFRAFRKHQKAMFAALAVLSMFIFVLTGSMSAGWDFFNGITQYFGVSSKYPVVATVYGKRIDAQEIQRVRVLRQVANYYMSSALYRAYLSTLFRGQSLQTQLQKDYPEIYRQVALYTQSATNAQQYQSLANAALSNPELKKKPDGIAVAEQMVFLRTQSLVLGPKFESLRGRLYFGGALDGEDLVNFEIWKHQADVRGIQYTKDEVQTLVNKDTQNLLTDSDMKFLDGQLNQRYGRLHMTDLLNALADEFRVRDAKEALGYAEPGSNNLPDPTPFDLWRFYKENRTTARLAVADIPVRNPEFLAKIGKPTEQELQELYEKNKNQDYSPQSSTPGFKQPAQIRVQWVHPQLDHFRARAKQANAAINAAMQIAAGAKVGATPADVLLPHAVEIPLLNEYENAKMTRFQAPAFADTDYALGYGTGTTQGDNIAATIGQAFGLAGAHAAATPLAGLAAYQAGGAARQTPEAKAYLDQETQKRLRQGVSVLLAGANRNPLAALTTYHQATLGTQYLPLPLVRGQLAAKIDNEQTLRLAREETENLQKQLEALSKLKNAGEAWHYLATPRRLASAIGLGAGAGSAAASAVASALTPGMIDTAAEDGQARVAGETVLAGAIIPSFAAIPALALRGELLPAALAQSAVDRALASGAFVGGQSDKLCDAYDIASDKGLLPLKEAYRLQSIIGDATGRRFAQQFFNDKAEPIDPNVYTPRSFTGGEDQYLYWNTAEKAAYVPTFAEARPRVLTRWEMEKARPLAAAAAKELVTKAEKGGQPEQDLRDAAKRYGGNFFELDGVARAVPSMPNAFQSAQMSFQEDYALYQIPEADRDRIPFPTPGLVDKLLELKKTGHVVYASDEPDAQYYVATALTRTEPSVNSFYGDYASPNKRSFLLGLMENDTHRVSERQQEIMERLRSEGRVQINKENLDKLKFGSGPEED